MCREEASVWRRGGDEPSSWRDSRREDSDRSERRDLGVRRDDRDRERDVRAPKETKMKVSLMIRLKYTFNSAVWIKNLNFLTDLI